MTDNNQKQEEQEERKPYQNSYRNTIAQDDSVDEVESEETEEANTEAKATSFVESKKDSKPKHNYKKRYDDLKKHYDEKIAEFKKYKEEQEAMVLTKNQIASNIGTTTEELESFKDEYPDVYKAMQTISSQHTQEQTQKLESEINALKEKEQRLVEEQARKELLTAHSDFFELKDTDEFLEWLEDQPSSIADGVLKNSTDSKWAIRVLDLYKSDKGLVKKQSRRSKKSAEAAEFIATKDKVVAEGKNERIWTVSEISRLKPHEFDKYEKEIDKASREGRITNQ